MARISYEQFIKEEQKQQLRGKAGMGYLAIQPGDSAIVRFNISDPADLDIRRRHSIKVGNRYVGVGCNKTSFSDTTPCVLCEHELRPTYRVYIPVLQYTMEEGKVVIKPAIWDQPASMAQTIVTYLQDYGDLRNVIMKIVRQGTKVDTTYTILPANEKIYKPEIYKADFSKFDNYTLPGWMLRKLTDEQMLNYCLYGTFEADTADDNMGVQDENKAVFNNASIPPKEDTKIISSPVAQPEAPTSQERPLSNKLEKKSDPLPWEESAPVQPKVKETSQPVQGPGPVRYKF